MPRATRPSRLDRWWMFRLARPASRPCGFLPRPRRWLARPPGSPPRPRRSPPRPRSSSPPPAPPRRPCGPPRVRTARRATRRPIWSGSAESMSWPSRALCPAARRLPGRSCLPSRAAQPHVRERSDHSRRATHHAWSPSCQRAESAGHRHAGSPAHRHARPPPCLRARLWHVCLPACDPPRLHCMSPSAHAARQPEVAYRLGDNATIGQP